MSTVKTMKQDVFAMWKNESKGKPYFTGKGVNTPNLVGFYDTNKKNMKEPDIRIYSRDGEGILSKEPYCSLWANVSQNGKKYLSGKVDGKRVVGFINEKTENTKRPYFSVYWSDVQQEKAQPQQSQKTEEPAPVTTADDLPF